MDIKTDVQKVKTNISFFTKLYQKLSGMLSEGDRFWSAMRWICVTTANTIVLVWAGLSIYKGVLQEIPYSVVSLYGIAVTGKFAQRAFGESKETIANINLKSNKHKEEQEPEPEQEEPEIGTDTQTNTGTDK